MIRRFRKSEAHLPGEQLLHRIAALTLGFGFSSAALAMALHRSEWAKGLAGGAILGWLNFCWLSRGIRAMMNAALAQSPTEAPASHAGQPVSDAKSKASAVATYFTLLFRYALVASGVYVIFVYLRVPLVSIGMGLCAFVAAIITATVWEVLRYEP